MSDVVNSKRKGARRKAGQVVEQPVAETVEAPAAPVAAPAAASEAVAPAQPLVLRPDELHKMKLYEVEARAARAEAETCRLRKKYFLALLDPKGTVEAEEKRQEKHLEKAREWAKKHELVIAHISMRLGVDLTECGFDPETGLVVVPQKSAKGQK